MDFEDILSKPVAQTEKPRAKPTGTYLFQLMGHPEFKKINTRNGEKKVVSFSLKALSPREDVDPSALAGAPEILSWPSFKYDIFYEGDGEWRLKKFLLDTLGLDEEDKSYKELLSETPGRQLLGTVTHRPFTNRDGQPDVMAEIGAVARA